MNRFWAAFKENVNVVALATTATLAAATTDVRPLLLGVALEGLYLVLVPNSSWYRARLAERNEEGEHERRAVVKRLYLSQLSAVMQARWIRLENVRESVAAKIDDDPQWFRPIVDKLDDLLEKWLEFGAREQEIRSALEQAHAMLSDAQTAGAPPVTQNQIVPMVARIRNGYAREIAQLENQLAHEADFGRQQLLKNRREVLQRRSDWAERSSQMRDVLLQQLELLEDTFGLVQDQLRARAPERVLADLESVLWRTKTASEQLQELSALEASALEHNPHDDNKSSAGDGIMSDGERHHKARLSGGEAQEPTTLGH